MRAGSLKNQIFAVQAINEQPVRFNMTVAMLFCVAGQLMVSVLGGQRFSLGKQFDDGAQFINIFVLFPGALVVFLELSRPDNIQTSSSSKS